MQTLVISVLNPIGAPQRAVIGPRGGTIGRSDHNTLMLSDLDRTVSRLHARVDWRGDRFVLVNMGIKAVRCNDVVLGTAEESRLAVGDVLAIGRFKLSVDIVDMESSPLTPQAEHDDDALFDDMTGLPLPPRSRPAAILPDEVLFADSATTTGPDQIRSLSREEMALAALLRGMGCAPPQWPARLSAEQMEQVGMLMREAMNDTMRQWLSHVSPAAQQAWFSRFDELFQKAAKAGLPDPAMHRQRRQF